jgi:hypothetical protein
MTPRSQELSENTAAPVAAKPILTRSDDAHRLHDAIH